MKAERKISSFVQSQTKKPKLHFIIVRLKGVMIRQTSMTQKHLRKESNILWIKLLKVSDAFMTQSTDVKAT